VSSIEQAAHHFEIVDQGADILGGNAAPAELIDEAAETEKQGLGLVLARIADDHRFAAMADLYVMPLDSRSTSSSVSASLW